jgi:hypothetical protein
MPDMKIGDTQKIPDFRDFQIFLRHKIEFGTVPANTFVPERSNTPAR